MGFGQLHKLLLLLDQGTHSTILLDQILSKAITASLIYAIPTWNCTVRAYSKSPTPIKSILIYNYFIAGNSAVLPDTYTYPALLKACSRLLLVTKGKEVHAHVLKLGLDNDIFVGNAFLHFYGTVKELCDARTLFDEMPDKDIASWNSLLSAYNANSGSWEVLRLFKELIYQGIRPDKITLVILLSACAEVEELECARTVHSYVIKVGLTFSLNLNNALLVVFAKCKDMDAALQLFHDMGSGKDVVSQTILINGYVEMGLMDLARNIFDQGVDKDLALWNSMIHAYVKMKHPKEALDLFEKMDDEGVTPDENTIVDVLAACASLADLQYGRLIHKRIHQNNIRRDVFVGTALINMFSKCGSLEEAMVIFYKMGHKDVYTWTTIIEALAIYGRGDQALSMFYQMEKQGCMPNEATFVSVLVACRHSGLANEGCKLFERMTRFYKIQPKIEHFGSLIDLLSRAGLLHQAEEFIKCMPTAERLIACKTLLSACINHSVFDLGEKIANELVKLDSQSHATQVLLSNFYAIAGQWAEVANIRRIAKEFNTRKEPGISSVDS
ncbi:putative pentatricopeptide repeat-containing protein [Tripterygium wilfordii]|uniref:Putative pentatricopeptide repeat-containing protein n=1 Tax=Tripterygium wilfordii TaxID=458696 RepID=A0A7J7CHR1_TRIWF|nr:pentatricopeptide repeat-containing protein At2g22410, mitochondrial-like [Tripterygium wilfordii]KAF5733603.1 putative pentatricopeptide repeat-containing protein [Tripterygium wilfordii]